VKLETGEYSTEEENKPVMIYAHTIEHLWKKPTGFGFVIY